jgi:hypothetical protein
MRGLVLGQIGGKQLKLKTKFVKLFQPLIETIDMLKKPQEILYTPLCGRTKMQ